MKEREKMSTRHVSEEEEILKTSKHVAVVGLSPKSDRPSFRIIPVNPQEREVLGELSYPDLDSIPGPVDVVDIFRRSELVPPIVEEAIKIGAKAVWMQEGVINEDAAERAREAGLKVVMDRCMLKEHKKLEKQRK